MRPIFFLAVVLTQLINLADYDSAIAFACNCYPVFVVRTPA